MKLFSPLVILSILFLFNCCETDFSKDHEAYEIPEEKGIIVNNDDGPLKEIENRKLIKEGWISFETGDIHKTKEKIESAIKNTQSYISSEEENRYSGQISSTLVIRVPASNFDKLLQEISLGVESFDRREIEVKDVTEQYFDLNTRLQTKKELEKRYLQLLEKAEKVEEILQIEREIGNLREEIESAEGRLKYLDDRISYSTLTVTFYEKIPEKTAFGNKFKRGFFQGWENLIWFFVFLVNIWPFIILLIFLIWGIYYFRRRRRN